METGFDRKGKTLILGLGNHLVGDDGLGIRAIERLAERDLPQNVCVREAGTPGFGLVDLLEGWGRVILVDAVHMGQSPGTWRRFEPHEVRLLAYDGALSLHQPGLAEGLALAQALGTLPEEIVFYGIEPASLRFGERLDHVVEESLEQVIDQIMSEI